MRLFGHPVHPILVALPLALLGLVPVFDGIALLVPDGGFALVAHHVEIVGLLGGALAAMTGFADFARLEHPDPAVTRSALRHSAVALVTLSIFAFAHTLRGAAAAPAPAGALALEIAGSALLAVTGWLGGHLVFEHGVGVRPGERRGRSGAGPAE